MPKNLEKALQKVSRQNSGVVISLEIPDEPVGENVFMGLGILSEGNINPGLGLNVLPMFCLIAQILKKLPSSKAEILIADTHALEHMRWNNESKVVDAANSIELFSQSILDMLGVSSYNVFKASENTLFQTSGSDYAAKESDDILTAHTELHCGVKVGWQSKRGGTFRGKHTVVNDERVFDKKALKKYPEQLRRLSFLRIFEGLTIDTSSDRHLKNVPPYLGTTSMILGRPIDIKKLSETRQMKNHLNKIQACLKGTLNIRKKSPDLLQDFVNDLQAQL